MYPEHDKLRAVKDRSQACYEFIEWLWEEKRITLAEVDNTGELWRASYAMQALLAEHFDTNLETLEQEKRAIILQHVRDHDAQTHPR